LYLIRRSYNTDLFPAAGGELEPAQNAIQISGLKVTDLTVKATKFDYEYETIYPATPDAEEFESHTEHIEFRGISPNTGEESAISQLNKKMQAYYNNRKKQGIDQTEDFVAIVVDFRSAAPVEATVIAADEEDEDLAPDDEEIQTPAKNGTSKTPRTVLVGRFSFAEE
jgi:hypothetical protein